MKSHRVEHDSMGDVRVPSEAYYGAQTQRAIDNFSISGERMRPELIRALGLVKYAAILTNRQLGMFTSAGPSVLSEEQVAALLTAAQEVAEGQFADQFPIDVFQTGSGTSTNMNVNEVISNRAIELAGGDRFTSRKTIHPNDHVNLGQSTNDIFPTAIHVAVARTISRDLVPALNELQRHLADKSAAWSEIVKIGRTHLADATPLTLGQEFGGFARQVELAVARARKAIVAILELPVGGTAVGTGINTHSRFGQRVAEVLARETGIPFVEANDHFEANAQRDGLVECHGELRTIALSLFNIANAIRWLGSGPRCGIYEISIPDLQPGSSIMPGKVNPVLCESLMQVVARVIGHDQTVAYCAATGSQFQLNMMLPVLGQTTLDSVALLARATREFSRLCVAGLEANVERCTEAVEKSLSLVTSLNPLIGYERAAEMAKRALQSGKSIREVCLEAGILTAEQLDRALNARKMTAPTD